MRNCAAAYVDGSFNQAAGICGYGIVFFDQDSDKPEMISGRCQGGSWNVSGEITAALVAVRKALSYGCEKITIYHDYIGIAEWVIGNWRTKTPETIDYSREMLDYMQMIEITFRHVKAHTGVKWNEEADRLAKQAAGITGKKKRKAKKKETVVTVADKVNPKCRESIERFSRISKPKFSDYRDLRTYGLDSFSKKTVKELEDLLGARACSVIRNAIHDQTDYASALRWAARGLPSEEAAHKANVDAEVRENCCRR